MLEILPIPAFKDNYIWLLHNGDQAIAVDPGDAQPLLRHVEKAGLQLSAVLITHHHSDHIGGVAELLTHYNIPVYAPAKEHYTFPHRAVAEGDRLHFPQLDLSLSVMEIPGHTLGHVAYYNDSLLFCGDTLFSCGCGRIFEGTTEQMYASLQRLAQLPDDTKVYCTHEYTLHNMKFARQLDPENHALQQQQLQVSQLRKENLPSLPSTIGLERAINPFLRCHTAALRKAANAAADAAAVTVFGRIRSMRNNY